MQLLISEEAVDGLAKLLSTGLMAPVRKPMMCSYLGGLRIDWCVFLVGIMPTVSWMIAVALNVKAVLTAEMKARVEVNVTKIISLICVVAGTALLGRSGDVFPILQGSARIGASPAV